MTSKISLGSTKSANRPKTLFWLTLAIWILLLIPFLFADGFGVWLAMFALFLIVSALYSLLFGRPSWLGLPHRKGAGAAMGAGVVALIVGALLVPAAPIDASEVRPLADVQALASSSATPSASPTPSPSPSPAYVLLASCGVDGKSVVQGTGNYVCTPDDNNKLVWMKEKDSKALIAGRVEAKKLAEEKLVAEKAAAEQAAVAEAAVAAEAARVASEAAVAEAARVAAEQAAAAEAARNAAVQPPAPQQQAPAGGGSYSNCAEAKAAGAAPLYRGQQGYAPKLDRDGDGIACEK